MAKKKSERNLFRLSGKAGARLNAYLAEIRKGIMNVCELHTYDNAPSMNKSDFETTYVDRVLSQPVAAISASIRAMTQELQAQKEKEAREFMRKNDLSAGDEGE